MVRKTWKEACDQWGEEEIRIAALAAIERPDGKFRIVFDGTHFVLVNGNIKVRDAADFPSHGDQQSILGQARADGGPFFGLTYDVEGAHRIIRVAPEDWPKLGCRAIATRDLYDFNTCGTFGVNSAGMWFGRYFAALTRASHYILGRRNALYHIVMADDGNAIAKGDRGFRSLWLLFIFLEALGTPIKWTKVHGGPGYETLGLWVDLATFSLGISEKRRGWCVKWLKSLEEDKRAKVQDFREGLGRIGFAAGPLWRLRTFLGPAYAWAAACPPLLTLALPMLILITVKFLRLGFERARVLPCYLPCPLKRDIIRFDAKAQGDDVAIGGWRSDATSTREAAWYAVTITRKSAPWVWSRGEPFRTIASLELLAALISMLYLVRENEFITTGAQIFVHGFTDNQGNQHVINKNLCTKMPIAAILMELNLVAESRGVVVSLEWVPRLQNEEADALTNGDYSLFDADKRVNVDIENTEFIAMRELLTAAEEYEKALQAQKEAKAKEKSPPRADTPGKGKRRRSSPTTAPAKGRPSGLPQWKRRVPLKERDPW